MVQFSDNGGGKGPTKPQQPVPKGRQVLIPAETGKDEVGYETYSSFVTHPSIQMGFFYPEIR